MYDYDALKKAWLRIPLTISSSTPSPVLRSFRQVGPWRRIDARMTRWPGHGLADDVRSQQFVEGE